MNCWCWARRETLLCPAPPPGAQQVLYVARRLGHRAELTTRVYGHVIEEFEDRPQLLAEEAIR
jgi:integrase